MQLGAVLAATTAIVAVPDGSVADAGGIFCNGLAATIIGSSSAEEILGTSGADVIHGGGGSDVIRGFGGDDVICGGTGNDTIEGGAGDDMLIGGKGADRIDAGGGNDRVRGGAGADWIWGRGGNDDLIGGGHRDVIYGGPGVDEMAGKRGADSLFGGGNGDMANGGGAHDACTAESEISCETEPVDFALDRVYVTQGVPAADSADEPADRVATIEGRGGLFRLFVTATEVEATRVPDVRLHWKDGTGAEGSALLTRESAVPVSASEGVMSDTFNYAFGSAFLDEGMAVYVEIDPSGTVPESNENNNRWPASGWYDLGVVSVPSLDVTFVPMTVNGVPATVNQTVADTLLSETLAVMPIADYTVEIHAPVSYNGGDWGAMLDLITQAKLDDGSSRIYVGIVDDDAVGCCTGGIGWIGWGASVALEYPDVVAHELGHNFDLLHAPCGGVSGSDPEYPYAGGLIGSWGYDLETGALKDPAAHRDLMSYCSTTWISDHNYDNAIGFRGTQSGSSQMTMVGENDVVVSFMGIIAGGASGHGSARSQVAEHTTGTTRITRVAAVDGAPVLPVPGDHRLVGVDSAGGVVTAVWFDPLTVEAPGSAHSQRFAFSVPIDSGDAAAVVEWQVWDAQGEVVAARDAR